jgi:hypothetical protein
MTRVTFSEKDLLVMKNLLTAELDEMMAHLATPAELSTVMIPLFKIETLLGRFAK